MEIDLDIAEKRKRSDNVLKIKYVKILRFFLLTLSSWPGDELGQTLHWLAKCYRYFLPLQCLTMWVGEVHYMVTNHMDFLLFGDTVVNFLLTNLSLMRLIFPIFKGYREVTRDFLINFHLIHFKHRGIHFDMVHRTVDKVSHYFTLYTTIIMVIGAILYNVPPIYVNYKNGLFSEEKHNITFFAAAIYISYPFFKPLEHIKAMSAFNVYQTFVCGVSLCFIDLLVILMAFHIIGHTLILRKNLESISRPEETVNFQLNREISSVILQYEIYSKEENENISLIFKDCVDHHRNIVRFASKMSNFFGAVLAANYTVQLVGCCILLLELTPADLNALIRFGPLTLIVFGQLIQISVIFEVVGTMSGKLPESLYSIPWECMDTRNQRSMCILLQRLQRPIHVTAMGMTTVGVTTMTKILKTTFSYFAFLRSFSK